jgi:hypothetical protein
MNPLLPDQLGGGELPLVQSGTGARLYEAKARGGTTKRRVVWRPSCLPRTAVRLLGRRGRGRCGGLHACRSTFH